MSLKDTVLLIVEYDGEMLEYEGPVERECDRSRLAE